MDEVDITFVREDERSFRAGSGTAKRRQKITLSAGKRQHVVFIREHDITAVTKTVGLIHRQMMPARELNGAGEFRIGSENDGFQVLNRTLFRRSQDIGTVSFKSSVALCIECRHGLFKTCEVHRSAVAHDHFGLAESIVGCEQNRTALHARDARIGIEVFACRSFLAERNDARIRPAEDNVAVTVQTRRERVIFARSRHNETTVVSRIDELNVAHTVIEVEIALVAVRFDSENIISVAVTEDTVDNCHSACTAFSIPNVLTDGL